MNHDLIIRNGTIVDGTGSKPFKGDIAVSGGKITEVGTVVGNAGTTIDATGRTVTPGFIDPHTHYDPQITWDKLLSSSSEHGITTVLLGNCGVGLAPAHKEDRDLMAQDLTNVESMSERVLQAGVQWDFETFPEYMDSAERRGCGINLAFLAPLAPFRTYVLRQQSSERSSTAAETVQIEKLLEEAMEAGAWGWSTTAIPSHIGYQGKPFAARLASHEELAVYARILKKLNRGIIELALTKRYASLADDEYKLLELLVDNSGRNVSWLSLHNLREKPNGVPEVLEKAAPLIARGALPQILTRSLMSELSLRTPFQLSEFKAAKPLFNAPVEEQMKLYADKAFRATLREQIAAGSKLTGVVPSIGVYKAGSDALKKYEGMTVGDLAETRGIDSLDCLFDIALEDRLQTKFVIPRTNTNKERIPELLRESGRTLIGLSDAGAHVDMFCEAGYTTYLLGHWVREQKAMTLEHAVKRITSEPADFLGMADRGRIKAGLAADLVVFDADTVGSPARGSLVHDLPAGGSRLYAKAEGIGHVIVNGKVLFEQGRHTGIYPGQVLRSH
jgi:N-acyl-D-amino-acid deacylase